MTKTRDSGCIITVLASPDQPAAFVCLAGEIDQAATERLSYAADRLATVAPAGVVVDLEAVTFAGATLPNFVARIYRLVPDGTSVVLCRPRPMTRWVLEATGMNQIATLRDDLPASSSLSATPVAY